MSASNNMSANNKLRILFLAANPLNMPPLQLDQEVSKVKNALQLSRHRDQFVLEQQWATRIEDLRRAMLFHEPQIVHFAGHGKDDGLILEDKASMAHSVSSFALANFFAVFPSVQCVILNACYSDELGAALSETVPYVIGMSSAVQDIAAIVFAEAFYDALGAGGSYEKAFRIAVNALEMNGSVDAATPVMVTGPNAGGEVTPMTLSTIKAAADKPLQVTRLSGPQFKQFHNALLAAFDATSLQQMVAYELEENLSAIAGGSNFSAIVFNLIDWAQRTGRLSKLIEASLTAVPHSPELQAFVASLR